MNIELLTSTPANADEVVKKLFENGLWDKFDSSASCRSDYETKGNTFKMYLEGDHSHTHASFDAAVTRLASKLGYSVFIKKMEDFHCEDDWWNATHVINFYKASGKVGHLLEDLETKDDLDYFEKEGYGCQTYSEYIKETNEWLDSQAA